MLCTMSIHSGGSVSGRTNNGVSPASLDERAAARACRLRTISNFGMRFRTATEDMVSVCNDKRAQNGSGSAEILKRLFTNEPMSTYGASQAESKYKAGNSVTFVKNGPVHLCVFEAS